MHTQSSPPECDAVLVRGGGAVAVVVAADQLSDGVEAAEGAHGMAVVLVKGELHEGGHGGAGVSVHVILQQWTSPGTGPLETLIQVVRVIADLLQQPQDSVGVGVFSKAAAAAKICISRNSP